VTVVRLTQVFRQAEQSRIVRAAYAVNEGRLPPLSVGKGEESDFYFAEADEPEKVEGLVVRLVRDRIPRKFGLDPLRDVQVLTPMNRSLLGARNLNRVLQAALNASRGRPEVERFGWSYHVGDKVIQTENDYDRDVFNGDLGTVEKVDVYDQELTVSFEGRKVTYDFGSPDALSPAYALSVHKSQGSEYPCVVIPVHTQHYAMLRRNLLYTAITRGRRLVVLVGSRRAVALAAKRADDAARFTGLSGRLREE
jgi:exodeoxyribonuclease V alpha subunit